MDESKYNLWLKKIMATGEEEISCSECFDRVSEYVEAELAGAEITGTLQQVKHHLDQCLACQDEYEVLRDFLKDEKDIPESSGADPL